MITAPTNARPPPTNSHGFAPAAGSFDESAAATDGLGRLELVAADGRALSLPPAEDAEEVGRAEPDPDGEAVGVARADAAGAREGIGGPNVGIGAALGRVGVGVGFAVGRGLAVGRGVGAGVGVAVGGGPSTTTVGPLSVGSLPGVAATNVTCQVPAGSVDWPVQVPFVAVPAVSASPTEAGPTTAVTELAAFCGLGVTYLTLNAKLVWVVPAAGVTDPLRSGVAPATGDANTAGRASAARRTLAASRRRPGCSGTGGTTRSGS